MTDWIERILDLVPLVAIGVIGACLHSIRRWKSWRTTLFSIACSGFGALLVGELARGMGWNDGIAFFVAGMIGYSGGSLVDTFLEETKEHFSHALDRGMPDNGVMDDNNL